MDRVHECIPANERIRLQESDHYSTVASEAIPAAAADTTTTATTTVQSSSILENAFTIKQIPAGCAAEAAAAPGNHYYDNDKSIPLKIIN